MKAENVRPEDLEWVCRKCNRPLEVGSVAVGDSIQFTSQLNTFYTVAAVTSTVITLTTAVIAIWFTLQFIIRFSGPLHPTAAPPRAAPTTATSRAQSS